MAILINNLTKDFTIGGNKKRILNNISLKINDGEMIAIQGRSGAGKSTFLHILGLLDKPTSGEFILNEHDVSTMNDREKARFRNDKIGFVLQDFGLIEGETAYNNVRIPLLLGKTKLWQMRSMIMDRLDQLGIADLAHKNVSLLSGGEKQRVAIARAVVCTPQYIFADEPTGALDSENATGVMDILHNLNKSGTTVIVVTHDEQIAKQCNRKIYLVDGKVHLS